MQSVPLDNAQIAELFALESQTAEGQFQRALRRAARRAFTWPEEAADIAAAGRSLTELSGIGPALSRLVMAWLEDPPDVGEPPEERRSFPTVAASSRILAADPEALPSVRGDLQMHTTYSDGGDSVAEMAAAAAARGYSYIAITDHSKGLRIARGIDEAELAAQGTEIDDVNRTLESAGTPLRVLKSLEMNLSPDGTGDMDPDALRRLDLVIGSFHSSLRGKQDQTERYLAALDNPDVHTLGHPRGRIYNHRAGLYADWEAVFARAAARGKAVEIDAFADRQDLQPELVRLAAASRVYISIGTDSHTSWQLAFMVLGIASAVAAGVSRDRILNLMAPDELLEWAAAVRTEGAAVRRGWTERRPRAAGSTRRPSDGSRSCR